MLSYLRREAVALVTLLLVASFVIFSIVFLAPGDPLSTLIGNQSPSPQRVAQLTAQYNLDKPFLEQYWIWLTHAVQGNLGLSTQFQQPVTELVITAAKVSLPLIVYAESIVIVVGLLAGSTAARWPGAPDMVVGIGTSFGVAIPSFVAAVFLSIVFSVNFGWFPATGFGQGPIDIVWHLTLPAISLAIALTALLARIGRSAMREEHESAHVTTEVARGIPEPRVFRRHVLRNSLPPMLAVIGLQVPALIAGTVVVEQAFNLGGLGSLLLSAVNSNDFPVVQAIALLIVFVTVFTGVIVDILHGFLDPRVTVGSAR
jgi:peptide/nickel transport system permease protein